MVDKKKSGTRDKPSPLEGQYEELFPLPTAPSPPTSVPTPRRIGQPRIIQTVVTYGAYEEPI